MYAMVWVALVVFRCFCGSAMSEEEAFTEERLLIEIPIDSRWLAILYSFCLSADVFNHA